MLDTNFNQHITFNSVAGTIVKSTAASKFIRVHTDSPYAKTLFKVGRSSLDDKPVEVLQIMLCSGGNLLIEYIETTEEIGQ